VKNLVQAFTKGAETVDDLTESAEERQKELTERQRIDMGSDNWLAKAIRPLSLLILLGVVCFIGIMSTFGFDADPVILGELVVLLGSAFGFYFDSRKREKIAAKNAAANVEIEKLKSKTEARIERKEARLQRRLARRAERKQDKE
jgi:NADPH:quinone reductase-like Zn-dependent oxidoreductase